MNKFVLSAIALTTAGGLATAGTGSEEWLTLDREIESLASAQTQAQGSGVTVGGFIRTSYQNSSDIQVDDIGGGVNDLGGFSMDNVRIEVTGTVGDYMLFIQADAGTTYGLLGPAFGVEPGGAGVVAILDAYGAWNINESFRLTMGQFRSPFLASAQFEERNLLFMDRTVSAYLWSMRDQGAMLSGNYDMLGWWLSVQNGTDLAGDGLALTGRLAFHAMGTGGPTVEGAYGAPEGTVLDLSAGYTADDDNVVDDLTAWNVEADLVMGPFSAAGSYVQHDDGYGALADAFTAFDYSEGPSIWSLQAGFMFIPDRWEAAIRWENLDDDDDSSVLTLGLNYYAVGHDAKWMVNYAKIDNDIDDASIFGFGLTVGV